MKASKTADKKTVNVIGKHKYAVTCEVGQQKSRTDVVEDLADNPTFNREFQFQVDDVEQPLVLLVTEKRERDVLGQIVVPLNQVDDCRSSTPLRVPLQPGLRCADLFSSPGELVYDVWLTPTSEDRSLSSRTTASLGRLRRRLNNSPMLSSSSRWNEFKTSRRHSTDVYLDLKSAAVGFQLEDSRQLSLHDELPSADDGSISPIASPEGYIKRSSLSSASEQYFPRPYILDVSPAEGPTCGGTVVTVRGRNLGLSRDDVVGLSICGSNVLATLRYISPERLVCTTVAWKPCVGRLAVDTASGGRTSSSSQFTFAASSEPSTSRVLPRPDTSTKPLRHRLSLGCVESHVYPGSPAAGSPGWDVEAPRQTSGKLALRRFRSLDITPAVTGSPEPPGPPVVEIQPMRVSPDAANPPRTLRAEKEDLSCSIKVNKKSCSGVDHCKI